MIITLPDGRLRVLCLLHSCGWHYTVAVLSADKRHRPERLILAEELDKHMEEYHT